MLTETDLIEALTALDRDFRGAIAEDNLTSTFAHRCTHLFEVCGHAMKEGRLSSQTQTLLRSTASRVAIIAKCLGHLEESCQVVSSETLEEARGYLRSESSLVHSPVELDGPASLPDSPDDPTTFTPYRQWFLDHFSNPYPSSKDKDALLKEVTVHTRRQLDTWYTNQRRRSGWHALKRKYGHISTLLKRIDDADEDDEEMQRAKKEVERVRAYFKNDRQDHVRDEIREIISQGPPTTSTKRRIESGPARRVGGKMASSRSQFPGNPTSTPAPLMPGSWTPYSVAQDDDFFAPAPTTRLQLAPRLPSDFSSPDSSRRTFSGSSASSTDSLISYDSLDIPVSTTGPGSPPASSSLLNFDGRSTFVHPSPARTSRHSPRRGSFVVRNSVYPTRPHPYFCTVNELPTGPAELALAHPAHIARLDRRQSLLGSRSSLSTLGCHLTTPHELAVDPRSSPGSFAGSLSHDRVNGMEAEEALAGSEAAVQESAKQAYLNPWVIVASSSSAISARVFTHPLDTIRIRIQTAGHPVPPLRELVPAPRVRGLYAGLPVAIGFSVPALSVYLATYEASKRYFSEKFLPQDREASLLQQIPVFVAAGTAAEFASGAIWAPLDVLKSRLQTGREGTSAVALTRKIIKNEGWMGLMRGYWMGTAIFVPNISVYWCIYESLKMRFIPNYSSYRPSSASPSSSAQPDSPSTSPASSSPADTATESTGIPVTLRYTLCSVSAVAVAACTTSPIEVIQARWQTSGGTVKGGISQIVRDLWRQEGAKAFTRGLGIRVAYAIPANGISMTIYESIKRWKGLS
ncbi:putative mitochondrial carrier C4G8.08 [Rhodotorula toruloides]|nr:putative mitochondrial carrier C4G8.08 [Rhodotorula toruloides]